MMLAAEDPDATLSHLLGARARSAAPSRLVLDILGGGATAGTTLWARPAWWSVILAASLCFLFYGIWAVAERRLVADAKEPRSVDATIGWRLLRGVAAVIGIAAFVGLLFSLLGVGLGTWTS